MNNLSVQRISLLSTMNELAQAIIAGEPLSMQNCNDMKDAFLAFGVHPKSRMLELLNSMPLDKSGCEEFGKWFERFFDSQIISANSALTVSESYETGRLGCDREFDGYIKLIKNNTYEALVQYVFDNLKAIKKNNPKLYELLTNGYRGWYFENNQLDGFEGDNNSLIQNRVKVLKENADKLCWLYNKLGDNLSRTTLNAIIYNWLTFSVEKTHAVANYLREAVDIDLFPIYDDEVFVDCGSYIGDTVAEYCNMANSKYKRIYTYDISEATVEVMKQNLASLDNIVYNVKGVGEKSDTLELVGVDQPFHGNKLSTTAVGSSVKVPVVKLDDDIKEPITFLKIDVEGLDKEAIRGAKEHIERYHPKLSIDSYHKLKDLFEIPLLINEIDPSYNLYLRIANSITDTLHFPRPSIYAI